MEDTVPSAVLQQVSRRTLERLEKGKKLSTENTLLLYMDMTYTELREIREEIRETIRRIDETNKRIDSIYQELSKRVDTVYRKLMGKLESVRRELVEKNRGDKQENRQAIRASSCTRKETLSRGGA